MPSLLKEASGASGVTIGVEMPWNWKSELWGPHGLGRCTQRQVEPCGHGEQRNAIARHDPIVVGQRSGGGLIATFNRIALGGSSVGALWYLLVLRPEKVIEMWAWSINNR